MTLSNAFTYLPLFLTTNAYAAALHIENRVPVEVAIDGSTAVELLLPTQTRLSISPGTHNLTLWVSGSAQEIVVDVPKTGVTTVVVGVTGITTHLSPEPPKVFDSAPRDIEIRSTSVVDLTFIIDNKRHTLAPKAQTNITLESGLHIVSLRSLDSTVIWAEGTLSFDPGEALIVQLRDGMLPEVIGENGHFTPAHAKK
jgi:hypothetical protein